MNNRYEYGKFLKSPYRALVMTIITIILGYFGWVMIEYIYYHLPKRDNKLELWLFPATIMTYVWMSGFVVSLVTIFNSKPLKKFTKADKIHGLLDAIIVGFFSGLVAGVMLGIIFQSIMVFIFSFILGFAIGLIVGFSIEFGETNKKG